VLALGFVVVSIASAAATYRWFERPIMDRRDRVAERLGLSRATSNAPAATIEDMQARSVAPRG
jgi:peptidoglycan/LPS O-acetylase OafA/YrhL